MTPPDQPGEPIEPASSAPAAGSGRADALKGEVTVEELSRTQQGTARRTAESKATIPHVYLQAEIDMTEAVVERGRLLKEVGRDGVAPTVHDLIIRACALALRGFPRVNASYRDGRIERYSRVNVGFAVAPGENYVVPTIVDTDSKSVLEIAAEKRRLRERARSGELTAPETAGGTFTVSNVGMYGISNFAPAIIPPQAAILGVGEVTAKPDVTPDGGIEPRRLMRVTLSCDNRVLHGADGAEFLGRVRSLLESPTELTD